MTTKPNKYYEAYEDRYRRVYAQGIDYWAGNPDEIETVIRYVDQFLVYVGAAPLLDAIVEFGCGEGFLGEYLLSKGYSYLGIDLSPSALEKAHCRVAATNDSFILGDITDLFQVPSDSFSLGLDNYCLHMLITDEDRKKYLSEIYRIVKPGGYAWFHEISQEKPFNEQITSLQDFLTIYPVNIEECEAREAYTPTGKKTLHLPRLPARFNNCDGYAAEISNAGFAIDLIELRESGVVIHARTKKMTELSGAANPQKTAAR